MSTSDASSRYEDEGARSRASTDELVDDIRHDINEQIYQVSVWRVSTVLLLPLAVLPLLSQYLFLLLHQPLSPSHRSPTLRPTIFFILASITMHLSICDRGIFWLL